MMKVQFFYARYSFDSHAVFGPYVRDPPDARSSQFSGLLVNGVLVDLAATEGEEGSCLKAHIITWLGWSQWKVLSPYFLCELPIP